MPQTHIESSKSILAIADCYAELIFQPALHARRSPTPHSLLVPRRRLSLFSQMAILMTIIICHFSFASVRTTTTTVAADPFPIFSFRRRPLPFLRSAITSPICLFFSSSAINSLVSGVWTTTASSSCDSLEKEALGSN